MNSEQDSFGEAEGGMRFPVNETDVNDSDVERPIEPDSIDTLLERYKQPSSPAWLVIFHGLEKEISAYNASTLFIADGKTHMLVRTEGKGADKEFTSQLAIFSCENGRDCYPSQISNLSEITKGRIAQDPAIAYVDDSWVVTWNEVEPNDPDDPKKGSRFKSIVAVGTTLDNLERKVESEYGTKGVRFVDLMGDRVGFTTRTSKNGKFKMCFGVVDSLKDITLEVLANAKEIEGLEGLTVYNDKGEVRQWTGPNQLQLLANGDLSLLFHVGMFIEESDVPGDREYDPAHCVLIPSPTGATLATYPEIIARAEDTGITVDKLPPKRLNLTKVVYPSCVIFGENGDEPTTLLAALSDSGEFGQIVPNPLDEWLSEHPEHKNRPLAHPSDRPLLKAA